MIIHMFLEMRVIFDSKTLQYIMVGYEKVTKGYRLYDTTEKNIIHSCDVQFTVRKLKNAKNE